MSGTSLLGAPPPYKVVGVVHLPPLPGAARGGAARDLPALLEVAQRDAATYAVCGVDALIVENFGDVPFSRGPASPYTIAAMTLATAVVRAETGLPVGVNVLRNDVVGAVSVAAAAGGSFVRANVYAGAAVTDQGVIEGEAEEVQLLIRRLQANIAVWADVDVKHAAPLGTTPIEVTARDTVERGLADAIVLSGTGTGAAADLLELERVRQALPNAKILIGSGITKDNVADYLKHADGVIVGTSLKSNGRVGNPVNPQKVRALARAVESAS